MCSRGWQRPRLSEARAAQSAFEFYGLEAIAVELPSERDRNFRLDCRDGRRFVLKVAAATVAPEALVAENAILAAAREAAGVVVPEVIPGDGGSRVFEVRDGGELVGRVRCLG